ncbi:BRO family protein [Glaesserella parasuis]|uniref:BRO-N domain-containing protein n=1 Tax=Glaesserella parasuis TaxID=738 RepID=UPI0024369372|nr:BRO family protein [Glaesserella parasuis]MDG6293685.1 BRO family protein [Glaesserella parasuis]
MSNQLTFQNVALTAIQRNSQTYISASDLSRALQYKCVKSVTNLFNANSDEFTSDMSLVIDSMTNGINGSQRRNEVRIFSLRGCHLIAMFARTPVAKDFRKWVLDILDREILQNSTQIAPLAVQDQDLLSLLVKSYHFLQQANELRNKVAPTYIASDIDLNIGGHYLYNLGIPLEQHLDHIKDYIHQSSERIMFVKGMLSLLEEPKKIARF